MMLQRFFRRAIAIVVAAGFVVFSGLAPWSPVTPAFASGPTITGTGSSYAAVAVNQWVAQMSSIYGDTIDYQTSASVIGLNEFAQKQVDFGASEIGYSTGQANDVPSSDSYQYLPDVAGATCLMYNLTGAVGEHVTTLRLNSALMAGIFTGTITNWDDKAIAALNPNIPLPNKPIVVVFRTDASGENYLFGDYLQHLQAADWKNYTKTLGYGDSPQAIWPYPQQGGSSGSYDFSNWVGQSGSDNASNYVGSTGMSITYVETAYAILHHEPCADIQNASGHYVAPSETADAVALEKAQLLPDLEQKLGDVYTNNLPQAYPISAYSYLLVAKSPKGTIDPAKGKVLGQFVQYFACAGQQAAGQLGYSPLPPNLVAEDFKGIAEITGAAKPPALSASTCKNPYIDGQTPLPGEPAIAGGGVTVPKGASGHKGNADGGSTSTGNANSGAGETTSTTGASSTGASAPGTAGTSTTAAGATTTTGSGATSTGTIAGTSGTTSQSGLYPGQQIAGGYGIGSKLPDKSYVGIDLQSAARGVSARPKLGSLIAIVLTLLVLAVAAVIVIPRRRKAAQ